MRSRSKALALGAVLAGSVGVSAGVGVVWGAFAAQTASNGNEVRSVPDFVAPQASGSVVQKSTGGAPGFVRSGASYRLLAAVADSGRPSSGIASVTGSMTDGPSGVVLTAGTYAPVAGQTYTHRSAVQAVGTAYAGTYTYALALADAAGNARTQTGFSVMVDNTAPVPTGIVATNHTGGIVGHPDPGDTVRWTTSEPLDAISLVAGWEGLDTTNVVVRLTNGSSGGNDSLAVYNAANTAALPLGTVDLGRTDYTTSSRTFGAGGTPSTLTLTGNDVVLQLGAASGSTTTAGGTGTLRWTPGPGVTDRAGNALGTSTFAEPGIADRDF
ncbi:hypothetical protein [Patulibacter americanus]|uniref:hypothetical protein n=1 Tax=Patulibacter americanus TaxID=588672 RepID=UPI0003B360CE|nr:hypothetical protein [Patulibacter americanus]